MRLRELDRRRGLGRNPGSEWREPDRDSDRERRAAKKRDADAKEPIGDDTARLDPSARGAGTRLPLHAELFAKLSQDAINNAAMSRWSRRLESDRLRPDGSIDLSLDDRGDVELIGRTRGKSSDDLAFNSRDPCRSIL